MQFINSHRTTPFVVVKFLWLFHIDVDLTYPQHAVDLVWFSDEKLFTIAGPRNAQNDRIYVHSAVKKRDVAGPRLLRTMQANLQPVDHCDCGRVHSRLYSNPFLEPGVKINNANITGIMFSVTCCYRRFDAFPATGTSSNKTVRQHIVLALLSSYWRKKRPTLFHLNCGLQIRRIWIRSITACEE